MCGLCIEFHLMDLLERECRTSVPIPQKDLVEVFLEPYAQESNFLMHCLKYARAFDMEDEALYVLHCRALEEIVLRPDSAMHNSLARIVLIKHYHAFKRFCSSRFRLEKIEPLVPHPLWKTLYDADFFFDPAKWPVFLQHSDLAEQSFSILDHYLSWWLPGHNQQKNDLDQKMQDTEAYDPVEYITRSEWDRFYDLFPILYFSLVYTGRHAPDSRVVNEIALKSPNKTPDFPGFDLWLRRKALIISIQNKGADFLLDNIGPDLPLDLAYYAFLKLPQVRKNKDQLITRIKSLEKEETNVNFLSEGIDSYIDQINAFSVHYRYQ